MKKNGTRDIHQLIDLIYETAIAPGKWPDLLNALAVFVETSPMQSLAISQAEADTLLAADMEPSSAAPEHISLAEALEHIDLAENLERKSGQDIHADQTDIHIILLGHFAKAIKIAKRLLDMEAQHKVVVSLLDHLPVALFIVNTEAEILETNLQATQMLAEGKALHNAAGKLHAPSTCNTHKLHKAIRTAIGGALQGNAGALLHLGDSTEPNDLMLFVSPIHRHENVQTPRVAVFAVLRKTQPFVIPQEVAGFYGLTPREMAVTAALVQGRNIQEISKTASVSEHTVRSQVKSILSKTNTHRQSDLIRLMLTGPGHTFRVGAQRYPLDQNGSKTEDSASLIFKGLPLPDVPSFLLLPDSRHMAYREYGDPRGIPLIYCHSIMGSRLELAIDGSRAVESRGIRLIIPDRPGIGCSDPRPKGRFLEWAEDLKVLADFLELDQFCMAGFAMGGQYALATAFALPKRVKHLSLVSVGVRPVSSSDFDAMLPFYRLNLKLLIHARPLYRLFSGMMRKGFFIRPENFFKQFGAQLADGDRPIFEDESFRQMAKQNISEGWRQGALVPCREIEAWMSPSWGFDLKAIQTPVDLWHGEDDRHVPFQLGEGLAKYLPHARRFSRPGQGHLMFFSHWPEMLDACKALR